MTKKVKPLLTDADFFKYGFSKMYQSKNTHSYEKNFPTHRYTIYYMPDGEWLTIHVEVWEKTEYRLLNYALRNGHAKLPAPMLMEAIKQTNPTLEWLKGSAFSGELFDKSNLETILKMTQGFWEKSYGKKTLPENIRYKKIRIKEKHFDAYFNTSTFHEDLSKNAK